MTDDEILYGKRQSPAVMRALDRMAEEVNTKIRQRGIARGFVCVQEDFNRTVLQCEKAIYWASIEVNNRKRAAYLDEADQLMRSIGVTIRYMLKNKALTIGEVGVLSKYKKEVVTQIYRWKQSIGSN